MRPTPIPDDEVWDDAERYVIGPPDGDPTNDDVRAVEALVDFIPMGEGYTRRFSMRCVPEADEAARIAEGAPVWLSFLGDRLHPFQIEVGSPSGRSAQQLRVQVTADIATGMPSFEAFVTGVEDPRLFVEGCIEALQKMLEGGLTPPSPT